MGQFLKGLKGILKGPPICKVLSSNKLQNAINFLKSLKGPINVYNTTKWTYF